MSDFALSAQAAASGKIFLLKRSELQGRLDPYFYREEFRELETALRNSPWGVTKLGDIAEFQYGLNREAKGEGNYVYVRITDIDEDGKFTGVKKSFLSLDDDEAKNYILNYGDVLVARIGTYGKTLYFDQEMKAVFAGYLIRISLDENRISPEYYFYFAQTSIYWKLADKFVLGGVQPQFNANTIANLKIPVPPKETQAKIVAIMDTAYQLKADYEQQAQELLDSIDDYLLRALGIELPETSCGLKDRVFTKNISDISGGRFDAEFHQEKYTQIENALKNGKYELKKLEKMVVYIKKGIEVGSGEYLTEGKKFLRIADFDNFTISDDGLKCISDEIFEINKEFQPKKGEILFSKDGTIGLCQVLESDFDGIISSGISRIQGNNHIDNYFLSYVLGNRYINLLFDKLSIGQIIKHLNINVLNAVNIPVPPLAIQKQISGEIKNRREKAKQLRQQAQDSLQQAKQSIESIILEGKQ